jgi:hypothetical protein
MLSFLCFSLEHLVEASQEGGAGGKTAAAAAGKLISKLSREVAKSLRDLILRFQSEDALVRLRV